MHPLGQTTDVIVVDIGSGRYGWFIGGIRGGSWRRSPDGGQVVGRILRRWQRRILLRENGSGSADGGSGDSGAGEDAEDG